VETDGIGVLLTDGVILTDGVTELDGEAGG
jgi:hypothetical protein